MKMLRICSLFLALSFCSSCALVTKIQNEPSKTAKAIDILEVTQQSISEAHDNEWLPDSDYNLINSSLEEGLSILKKENDLNKARAVFAALAEKLGPYSRLYVWLMFILNLWPAQV